jgi:hypothetical protein
MQDGRSRRYRPGVTGVTERRMKRAHLSSYGRVDRIRWHRPLLDHRRTVADTARR